MALVMALGLAACGGSGSSSSRSRGFVRRGKRSGRVRHVRFEADDGIANDGAAMWRSTAWRPSRPRACSFNDRGRLCAV